MKTLYARGITEEERSEIEQGLCSPSAFTVRRCQILLMSADEHLKPREIAERLKCSDQCVRDAIRAFLAEGVTCLQAKSRARHTERKQLSMQKGENGYRKLFVNRHGHLAMKRVCGH